MVKGRDRGSRCPRRVLLVAVLLTVVLAACTQAGLPDTHAMPDDPACTSPDPASGDAQASFEEANLLAAGEIFRTYGPQADPVREQIVGEIVEIDGQPTWTLQATYAATIDGDRRSDDWTLWIGFADNELTILCAQGPADVD